MRSYCFFVAAASGRLRPCALASFRAMPESLAAWAAEKEAGMVAVLHVLAVGLQHAGVRAGLGEHLAQQRQVQPERVPKPRPSARPAVLMFMTMLTSALTCAAWPAGPM